MLLIKKGGKGDQKRGKTYLKIQFIWLKHSMKTMIFFENARIRVFLAISTNKND